MNEEHVRFGNVVKCRSLQRSAYPSVFAAELPRLQDDTSLLEHAVTQTVTDERKFEKSHAPSGK
jgi:hypothetical protein